MFHVISKWRNKKITSLPRTGGSLAEPRIVKTEAGVRPPCTEQSWHSSLGRGTAGPHPGHTGTEGWEGGRHTCPPVSPSLHPGSRRTHLAYSRVAARSLLLSWTLMESRSQPGLHHSVSHWAEPGGTCGFLAGSWTGRVWSSPFCGSQFSRSLPWRLSAPSLSDGLRRREEGWTCWARCRGPWGCGWQRWPGGS